MVTQKTYEVSSIYNLIIDQIANLFSLFDFSENGLTLVEAPALAVGDVNIDPAQIAEMQKDLEEAAGMDLPEDDDF